MLDEFKSKHDDPSFKSFKLPEVGYSSHDAEKGSFDIGDPYTTNLHVGNINPATTGIFPLVIGASHRLSLLFFAC